jgi:tetratricopeptide (TPR) repeat protein
VPAITYRLLARFREFIQKYPNDALTPNAFYWLGESYYATTNYQVALEAFKHLLSQFPQSDKGARCVAQARLQPAADEAEPPRPRRH